MSRLAAIAVVLLLGHAARAQAEPDAQLKREINAAVARGQAYLKAARQAAFQNPDLNIPGVIIDVVGGNNIGSPALTGLALIESGLDARDPMVNFIAQVARQAALRNESTYEISLMIMFFDRLGEKADVPLIQFLTLRLLSGQGADGAYGYGCNGLQVDDVRLKVMMDQIYRQARLTTPDSPKKDTPPKKQRKGREDLDFDGQKKPVAKEPPKEEPKPEPKEEPPATGLHPVIAEIAKGMRRSGSTGGDHSNTQFATVGLWCGRRHHVDVDDALKALDKHYRDVQSDDGGWNYGTTRGGSSPSMTCAGLMGLAMGFGALDKKIDPEAIAVDRQVEKGLKYIGDFLAAAAAGDGGRFRPNDLSKNLYFMWSLERVGMVYGLTTIGKIDWYDWGARTLLAAQNRDGSWSSDGFHGGSTENSTALALLFLTRANLAEDLATSLKGKVKDPGTSRLVGGGDLSKLINAAAPGSTGPRNVPPKKDTPSKSDTPAKRDLFPTATENVRRLATALLDVAPADRDRLLAEYRDTKGGDYTDALALAAHRLEGAALAATRAALSDRLTRMTPSTLTGMLAEPNKEVRRAAALAAGAKGKERVLEVVPPLIKAIADEESIVNQAARASLKALTGQDFGPEAGATPAERGKARLDWQTWWAKQGK